MPLEVQLEVKILLPPLPQVNSSPTLEYKQGIASQSSSK